MTRDDYRAPLAAALAAHAGDLQLRDETDADAGFVVALYTDTRWEELQQAQWPEAAVRDFLAQHGYRVAPVTVDNGEWVWAFAYENVLDGQPDTPQRAATLQRLREGYIPYMLDKLDYYERQSRDLLGYALPQVWLMHANALNAATYAEPVAAVRRRGYATITLDEAMRDPA